MLIFNRQPAVGAATVSPLVNVSTSEQSSRTTANSNQPGRPTGDQALANGPGRPFSGSLVHPADGPNRGWVLATLLIGAVGVLLLLGIKDRGHRHPMNSTAARTGEVEKGAPQRGLFQDRYQARA